ncbi:MAG: DUF4404 family protein [Anaerolineales bacterium]|nr:DUF4404 family protein [Anaerolineales bacterium]
MTKDILEKLHAELESVATDLTDEEQEALLRDVQALIRSHLHEAEQPSLTDRLEATAVQFGADHPKLAENLIFAINSLSNAGI